MIAVPCWSSWNTGMFRRSLEATLDLEALGRLDVLEVDPPKVGSRRATVSTSASGRRRVDLDVEDVDVGELLEEDRLAFHHRLGGERADEAAATPGL